MTKRTTFEEVVRAYRDGLEATVVLNPPHSDFEADLLAVLTRIAEAAELIAERMKHRE